MTAKATVCYVPFFAIGLAVACSQPAPGVKAPQHDPVPTSATGQRPADTSFSDSFRANSTVKKWDATNWTTGDKSSLQGAVVTIASASVAAATLGSNDEFSLALTDYDRKLRTNSQNTVSKTEFLTFAAAQGQDFWDEEKTEIRRIITEISLAAGGIPLHLPDHIVFVKSTQKEEFDANYTRGHAIVLGRNLFEDAKHTHADRVKLIAHEMYHVISRFDASLRRRSHEAVGCVYKGSPLVIDEQTRSMIITNPDAHEFACALQVTLKSGVKKWVMPATVLKVTNGVTPTFADITTKLLLVDAPGAQWQIVRGSDGKAQFIETSTTNYDQIMNINTDYNIHAEEVVAENFPLMLTENTDGVNKTGASPSINKPDFIKKLKAIFEK
jgi:hypothetical protein